MKGTHIVYILLAAGIALGVGYYVGFDTAWENAIEYDGADGGAADPITPSFPKPNQVIASPLVVTGEARGEWYFEATFPIVLVDWDGKIIGESFATAQGAWMTTASVPFSGAITFTSPYKPGDPDFMRKGVLVLQKANPSGLPEHDAAIEIPILFAP